MSLTHGMKAGRHANGRREGVSRGGHREMGKGNVKGRTRVLYPEMSRLSTLLCILTLKLITYFLLVYFCHCPYL